MATNELVDTDRATLNYAAVLRLRRRGLRVAIRYGLPQAPAYVRDHLRGLLLLGAGRVSLDAYMQSEGLFQAANG